MKTQVGYKTFEEVQYCLQNPTDQEELPSTEEVPAAYSFLCLDKRFILFEKRAKFGKNKDQNHCYDQQMNINSLSIFHVSNNSPE